MVFFCSGRCFWCPGICFFCPWNRFECYWNRFFGSPWYFRCPEGFFLCPTEMKCPRVFLVPVSFGDFVAWFNEKRFTKQRYGGVESRNNCSNACPRLKSATYKMEHHISEELSWSNGEVVKNEWRELRIYVWRSANSWGVVCSVEAGSIVVLLYLIKIPESCVYLEARFGFYLGHECMKRFGLIQW